jgi:hypothetical protein
VGEGVGLAGPLPDALPMESELKIKILFSRSNETFVSYRFKNLS